MAEAVLYGAVSRRIRYHLAITCEPFVSAYTHISSDTAGLQSERVVLSLLVVTIFELFSASSDPVAVCIESLYSDNSALISLRERSWMIVSAFCFHICCSMGRGNASMSSKVLRVYSAVSSNPKLRSIPLK
jgi:hypothetical protein